MAKPPITEPPATKTQRTGPRSIKSAKALKVAYTDDMVTRTKSAGYLSDLLHTMLTDKDQASHTFYKLTGNTRHSHDQFLMRNTSAAITSSCL
jgi:hypothetical protein